VKRLAILTGNHLCHNPRVLKEATSLVQAGYAVEVLGAWFDPGLKRKDQELLDRASFTFTPVVDLTRDSFARTVGRAKSKLGRLAHKLFGIESEWQLGPGIAALKKAAYEIGADFFIAHSESGMVVAAELLKRGKAVGIDMEDWFSEDLLPEARKQRPLKLLRRLETELLRSGAYKTCTSHAMAEALAHEYGCKPPVVIYNAFPWSDRKTVDRLIRDRKNRQLPSIHWYSQTLGPGRGLEDLIAALPFLQREAEIHLRGSPTSDFSELLATVPESWRNRVFVNDLVSNEELLSRIAEHDIGFAGEQKFCRSRDLTVTNKILHYLLAGLAVVASDTPGQQEVAIQAQGAVDLYRAGDPQDLATKLNVLLSPAAKVVQAKAAALAAAKETFCWEKQAAKLLRAVEAGLQRTG